MSSSGELWCISRRQSNQPKDCVNVVEYACPSSEKRVYGWLLSYPISVPMMFYNSGFLFALDPLEYSPIPHLTFLSIRNLDIHSSQFKAKLTCSRQSFRLTGKSQTF
jgi:hypothetical protein